MEAAMEAVEEVRVRTIICFLVVLLPPSLPPFLSNPEDSFFIQYKVVTCARRVTIAANHVPSFARRTLPSFRSLMLTREFAFLLCHIDRDARRE